MPSLVHVAHKGYVGRFAPSPTGPLHLGSLVAALASWLDARAHHGDWLVRIEDLDTARCVPGADRYLLHQLAACGLVSDGPVVWQSQRSERYRAALDHLVRRGSAYPCACSRKDIEAVLLNLGVSHERHRSAVYPGTCRPQSAKRPGKVFNGLSEQGDPGESRALIKANTANGAFEVSKKDPSSRQAWRFELPGDAIVHWSDRLLGSQRQDVAAEVGDFVVRRADGLWAYQLAVVVDDAAQGITHVVRGEDLSDNTPRQILLQRAMGLPTPQYLHTALVLGSNGEKLSKQNGAVALDLAHPLVELNRAAAVLGLPPAPGSSAMSTDQALAGWTTAWASKIGTADRTTFRTD